MPTSAVKKSIRRPKAPRGAGQVNIKNVEKPAAPPARVLPYQAAVGRRKTAVARVRITPGTSPLFTINGKPIDKYFGSTYLRETAAAPLQLSGKIGELSCSVKVSGGGFRGQAEAIRHGVARALLKLDATLRPTLKPHGFLSRDPRMKERKKPGLHRARRAPQWAKR